MKKIFIIFYLFAFQFNGFAQPAPYPSTLLFNLVEKEKEYSGNWITPDELKSKNITFLSYNENSELRYDTIHKAFAFTTMGFECKDFMIIYNNDTIFINYPSLPFAHVIFVKMPIPLNGKSFSFYNKYTYDALNTNHYYNKFSIFYLCQGCWISEQYEMSKEYKEHMREYFPKYNTINMKK